MKQLFDQVSDACSQQLTKTYSTSFSTAVRMLAPSIRQDIYNIYGYVRLADEIVDSFLDYDQYELLTRLKIETTEAIANRISLNPVLNAFQHTVNRYNMPVQLIHDFLKSMETDLEKKVYASKEEYDQYIYGSADVVGLMCLHVFVKGDTVRFNELKHAAMRLGSAFQKVNFLRDFKADFEILGRVYFPGTDFGKLNDCDKKDIIAEIRSDLEEGFGGIRKLPLEAKLGVYVAYRYYRALLSKLDRVASADLKRSRIRVPSYRKLTLFARCYFDHKLNLI
ncbi:phytoene/squalene synthase family protein [Flavobacterium sp. MAH-1]|uniref:Phytoene/squalene synthase family protein n=1 Tax=Flavobacterium agri TaxID=2743471 RepID=A0A7Y8Y3K1_9FLAO|nr:phytoene/squalene synthase family protein [Flavobacterium agri]NUY81930.1 phytoene/squalene synthase family protein [Flavobacterium agri]NYA71954.1 phytoene/squalene synthase family protein [Flavobacterium agri]